MRIRLIRAVVNWAGRVSFPGLEHIPLATVVVEFWKQLQKENLTTKASAMAFNFMLALFPAVIFFFTLIAYIPIDGLTNDILLYFKNLLPANAYATIVDTLEDILSKQRGDLLSFGFITALLFASNAIFSMMRAFDKVDDVNDRRSYWLQRLHSLSVTVVVTVLLVVPVALLTFIQVWFGKLVVWLGLHEGSGLWIMVGLQWLSTLFLFLSIVSCLFYFGGTKSNKYRLISPGSMTAALGCLITTLAFKFYVNSFDSYNKLYGSIGTLVVFMLLVYFNALVTLFGYEMNAGLTRAKQLEK